MTRKQRVQVAMLGRSDVFGAAHADKFPEGSAGQRAFAVIAAVLAEVEAAGKTRSSTREGGRGLKVATRNALLPRLHTIARTARAIAEEVPGADSRFQPPAALSDVIVLTSARAFLDDLVPVKNAFVQHGLPETFIDDLQQATDAFARAVSGRSAVKTGLADASASLTAAIRRGLKAARLLDVIVPNVFGAGSPAAEKWKRERHTEAFTSSSSATPETTAVEETTGETVVNPAAATPGGEPTLRRAS